MKKFEDLIFKKHPCGRDGAKQAVMKFENGWRVSVLQGRDFHSDINTFEVCFDYGDVSIITGHVSKERISKMMLYYQQK